MLVMPLPSCAETNPAADKWDPIVSWFNARQAEFAVKKPKKLYDTLIEVNADINSHFKFEQDEGRDTWSNPEEFFQKKGGDCEDFAIAKMYILATNGVPLDNMEIWIVNRNAIQTHAVLAVLTKKETMILDDERDNPYPKQILLMDFVPKYAVSMKGWRKL